MASWDGIIDPPQSFTVHEPAPLLYAADGLPMRRQIGFRMQTSGTAPGLSDGVKKTITTKPPKKAKK